MKTKAITFFLCILCGAGIMAQTTPPGLKVTDIRINTGSGNLDISFKMVADAKATNSDYQVIITPVIQQYEDSVELTPILLQGKKAKISEQRYLQASGTKHSPYKYRMENGGTVTYNESIPLENWMTGARLSLQGISIGCCSATETLIGTLADNILTESQYEEVVEIKETRSTYTTADRLADDYPFLMPLSEYNANDMNDREGALTIYFHQGKSQIVREFKNNNQSLIELISAVRTINASADSHVAKILIAGFASPEGSASFNEQLAGDRARALKYFVVDNGPVAERAIEIYNGGVDWYGLRQMVAQSNMYERNEILDIIDNTPAWDSNRQVGRLGRLMNLRGGEPYRYMLHNIFPLLRNAAYIRVYYENN